MEIGYMKPKMNYNTDEYQTAIRMVERRMKKFIATYEAKERQTIHNFLREKQDEAFRNRFQGVNK
jgi:hypothetical protein